MIPRVDSNLNEDLFVCFCFCQHFPHYIIFQNWNNHISDPSVVAGHFKMAAMNEIFYVFIQCENA